MTIRIRPYPVLTVITGVALVALGYLTVWQFQRADWKRGLIEAYSAQAETTPLAFAEGVCDATEDGVTGLGLAVSPASVDAVRGSADDSAGQLRMFGRSVRGEVGWRLFEPVTAENCDREPVQLLVEEGFQPVDGVIGGGAEPFSPERYVIAPWPDKPTFPPDNAPSRNEWYWFDADRIALSLEAPGLNRQLVVLAASGVPDFLTRTPPSRHIGYAVTWLGMAIALLFVYVFLHLRAGRFKFSEKDQADT